jgi:hypothetical protein
MYVYPRALVRTLRDMRRNATQCSVAAVIRTDYTERRRHVAWQVVETTFGRWRVCHSG